MTFDQIIDGLGASNVADRSTNYNFGENYDMDGMGHDGKWSNVFPVFDDVAGAKNFFTSNGYDVPLEKPAHEYDEDEYLEFLNESIREICQENDYYSPMMNYYYEIDLRSEDAEAMQARIDRYGGCCILVMLGDEPKLCLAGGGMNLTWDIVWSYILCGQLPPTKYCELPEFAGHSLSRKNRLIIKACRKSLKVHQRWLDGTRRNLECAVTNIYNARKKKHANA
jgi:hypothetical protein